MKSKGFTLIELLVVVAIISLLTSVVLASLVSAKEKARGIKFRQEVGQLILAIELYREYNNGELPLYKNPNPNNYTFIYKYSDGSTASTGESAQNYYNRMSPYFDLKSSPKFPEGSSSPSTSYLSIASSSNDPSGPYATSNDNARCIGDTVQPLYVVKISGLSSKYFSDWPGTVGEPDVKCFSLK